VTRLVRFVFILCAIFAFQQHIFADDSFTRTYKALSKQERWNLYVHSTFLSPTAYFGAAISAVPSPFRSGSLFWGSEFENYAARVGDSYARTAISNSIEALTADMLGQEVRYIPCNCSGFFPRLGHAMAMSVVTYNNDGHYVPAVGSIAGTFGAQFIGDAWMPDDYRTTKHTMESVGVDVALNGLTNVVREFWRKN
jgi:hypothetical protein